MNTLLPVRKTILFFPLPFFPRLTLIAPSIYCPTLKYFIQLLPCKEPRIQQASPPSLSSLPF